MNWNGVFPAVTTKFHGDGSIDYDTFFLNLEAQIDAGVSGVILGGTLGESSVLEDEEKIELTKKTKEKIAGRVPVVLNIAEGSTAKAIYWAKKAEELGLDALMLLPPMRYPSDHRETVTYFKTVAQATHLPIMIYNNPVDYKTYVTLEMFDELMECENIQAVKESTRDVSNVTRMKTRFGDRYKILCGVDTLTMESVLMGADGLVAGLVCAFPKETVVLFDLCKERRIEEALPIYQWFLPLLELDIHPKLVQYIKLAEQMAGIGTENVRAPRLTLIGEERARVEKLIQTGLENRPELAEIKTSI
ncbi:dihydrodipicolinate synthase family protein [Echinicola vietnamensis]|uniref:Dihydrodipicolinate synthase/N-acetylneuraminate lyase n=1 Tax=Echinicola vietnamensis (strain DSM 17526 / LMG 23754 / KMM 6221) TaxID=926556 RepID=L0G4C9_ECHVK|nr:dihydrodipicolinate synthase family protein [Echinicola vietnamensis]AGA80163.1 dihydrodipicolinate synthase/N-acetylneuraminate lyase [Echinicola vietnamensis DSM 17526]